ncbi:hypothetical protein [Bacteroides sp. MSB163]|uniref:hypothetical protein n=1 Tax=Bacteroides maternus TaxID=3117552 RepID=UPI002EDB593C
MHWGSGVVKEILPPIPQGNTRTAIRRTNSNSPSRQDLPEAILLSLQSGDLGFINEAEQDIAINIRQPATLPEKKMLSVTPGTKAISPERLLSPLPFRSTTPEVPPPEAVATPPHNRTPPGASPPHPAALAVASQRPVCSVLQTADTPASRTSTLRCPSPCSSASSTPPAERLLPPSA